MDFTPEKSILVGGYPPGRSLDPLAIYLQSNKRSGGGDVEYYHWTEDGKQVLIVFDEADSVDSVMNMATHTILLDKRDHKPITLKVSRLPKTCTAKEIVLISKEQVVANVSTEAKNLAASVIADTSISVNLEDSGKRGDNTASLPSMNAEDPSARTLRVTGFSAITDQETVEMYFANKKRSGGGDIEHIAYNTSSREATITFLEATAADRVLSRKLKLEDAELTACLLKSDLNQIESIRADSPTLPQDTIIIRVTNTSPTTTRETLRKYFENTQRSGGGKIKDIFYEEESASWTILFSDQHATNRILQRDDLILEDSVLKVEPVPPSRGKTVSDGIVQPDKVLIKGLTPKLTHDNLVLSLEDMGYCVDSVEYGTTPGVALVTFTKPIDFLKLAKHCMANPVEGIMLEVHQVSESRHIQVHNIAGYTEEFLTMYFENPVKSGGGEILQLQIVAENKCALFGFKSSAVVSSVLGREHRLRDTLLHVAVYWPELGIIPPECDRARPIVLIPKAVTVPDIDMHILAYIISSKQTLGLFEEELLRIHTGVVWPDMNTGTTAVELQCVLTPQTEHVQQLAKQWESVATATFQSLLRKYTHIIVHIPEAIWQQVIKKIQETYHDPCDRFCLCVDEKVGKLHVTGAQDYVENVVSYTRTIMDVLIAKADKDNSLVKKIVTVPKKEHVMVLVLENISGRLIKKFPDLQLQISNLSVELEGPSADVQSAQLELFEIIHNIVTKTVESDCIQLMQNRKAWDHLQELLQKEQLTRVAILTSATSVTISSLQATAVDRTSKILDKAIVCSTLALDEYRNMLCSGEWEGFVQCMEEKKYKETLIINTLKESCKVKIITLGKDMPTILEEVNTFVENNTILENIVHIKLPVYKLVVAHGSRTIQKLEQELAAEKVSIKLTDKQGIHGIQLCGTKRVMNTAKKHLDKILEQVVAIKHTVGQPGVPKYFTEGSGKHILDSLRHTHAAVIEVEDDGQDGYERDFNRKMSGVNVPGRGEEFRCNGTQIYISQGDLTHQHLDAVVSISDRELRNQTGQAAVISKAAGCHMQNECDSYIRTHGKLKEGRVLVTGAGSLPCKAVIHAVAPTWNKGSSGELGKLEDVIHNCLDEAVKRNMTCIAIPAVGSGQSGFPLSLCTATIVEVIRNFTKIKPGAVKVVQLMDSDAKAVREFLNAAKTIFSPYIQPASAHKGSSESKRRQPTVAEDTINTNEGLVIKLAKGELSSQHADVIVDATSKDLNLRNSSISSSLLRAGGSAIQEECMRNRPRQGLREGQVLITGGGRLHCQEVYHGWCTKYDSRAGDKVLRKFVAECLVTASKKKKVPTATLR